MSLDALDDEAVQMAQNHNKLHAGDENLPAHFYTGSWHNKKKSEEAGRPIFEDVPFIKIRIPGDSKLFGIDTRARINESPHPDWSGYHNLRFPKQWAAYKAGLKGVEAQSGGMPLHMWAPATRAMVEMLKHNGIYSVEQLAGVNDANIGGIPGGLALRQTARDYIEAAKGTAHITKMRAELEASNEAASEQKQEIEELKRQMSALLSSQAAAAEANKPAPEVVRPNQQKR